METRQFLWSSSIQFYMKIYTETGHKTLAAALVLLTLLFLFVMPLRAAEPLKIVVTGIEGDVLKNVLATLVVPAGLTKEGPVDNQWLERFAKQSVGKVKTAMEPFGYYNAQVTATIKQEAERLRLKVGVNPGEPLRLTDVKVNLTGPGSAEKPLVRMIAAFPLKKGDIVLQQRYEDFKGAFLAKAHALGYLDAEFSRHEIHITKTATTATIDLNLKTGEKYFFGTTDIKGAPQYPESFIHRYLAYSIGDVFSSPRLGETQRNLTNSERFKEIVITPKKQKTESFRVPIAIHLKPAPEISLRPGIGYGTDTGARVALRYRDLNMFNLGHELYSYLFISQRLQGLAAGYTLPDARDAKSSTTLQLNLQQEDAKSYTSKLLALELDRNRSFDENRLGTAYMKIQVEDYSVGTDNSTARLFLPGLRFSKNSYDNQLRPHKGYRYAFDLHGTSQVIGSDTALLQLLAEGNYLMSFPWHLSLHTRAKAGVTLSGDPIDDIPPSLRFYAGGAESVRGYSYQSLGPRDDNGNIVGGRQLLTASMELERALFSDWGLSVFYDIGNAFNSYSNVGFHQGTGIGLHYYTSFGTLNLSFAEPLGVDKPSLHIHFTMGLAL